MLENNVNINFYLGKLGNEDWICSCDEYDLMAQPNIGDLVWLPLDGEDEAREMYVIIQKYISKDEISYFCKPYNWED